MKTTKHRIAYFVASSLGYSEVLIFHHKNLNISSAIIGSSFGIILIVFCMSCFRYGLVFTLREVLMSTFTALALIWLLSIATQ